MGDLAGHEFHGNQWTSGGVESADYAKLVRPTAMQPPKQATLEAVQSEVAGLPKGVMDILKTAKDGPPTIMVHERLVGKMAIGHRNAIGLHSSDNNVIRVLERSVAGQKNADVKGTAIHEIGHAIQTRIAIPGELRGTFEREHGALPQHLQRLSGHYVKNEGESFAETFAHIYSTSTHSGNIGRAVFERAFPESIRIVKEHVESTHAALVKRGYIPS
jgi:hypothetical protein